MSFEWISVDQNDIGVITALLGGFILLFGFVSLFIKERIFLSESLVAMLVGIICGPYCISVLDPAKLPASREAIMLGFSEIVIVIQIMNASLGLPAVFWKERWKSLAILYGPVMLWMWLSVALLIWLLLPFSWVESLIIAACTCSTDPVLANSIVTGRFAEKYIPVQIRDLLSGESCANDGLALPYFSLGLFLLLYPTSEAWGAWFYRIWLYELGVGIILGATIGYLSKIALRFSEARNLIDKRSFLSVEVALALFVDGLANMFNLASFMAVFAAGIVVGLDGRFDEEKREAHVQEVVDNLLTLSFFVYFGSTIPWNEFNTPEMPLWRLVVIALLLFLVRRLPAVLAFHRLMPPRLLFREALLVGWFGPIGVAALWYMAYATEHLPHAIGHQINTVVQFIVFMSVLVYGVTVPFVKLVKRTLTVVRTRTLTGSRGVEIAAPKWPSDVPMTSAVISGPVVVQNVFSPITSPPPISPPSPSLSLSSRAPSTFQPYRGGGPPGGDAISMTRRDTEMTEAELLPH